MNMKMNVAIFHKGIDIKDKKTDRTVLKYPAKCVAAFVLGKENDNTKSLIASGAFTIAEIDAAFKSYNVSMGKKNLFTHIGGGIGDVLAFSSVAEYLKDCPISIHTENRFFPVTKWFSNKRPFIKPFFAPIFTEYTPFALATRYKDFRRLPMEYAAVEAREVNWFDAMFQRIGLPGAPEGFDRPHLSSPHAPRPMIKQTLLIKHRSSCQMRSSTLEDFYIPTRQAYPKHKIYVDEIDLTETDRKYIARNKRHIHVIPAQSIEDHLQMLYEMSMVVCSDSSAIHFREGMCRPAVAVYGAMTKDSRTKGYRYTHSFDVLSGCDMQPCFLHELTKNQTCPMHLGDMVAPCQSGESFREQLLLNLNEFRYNILNP